MILCQMNCCDNVLQRHRMLRMVDERAVNIVLFEKCSRNVACICTRLDWIEMLAEHRYFYMVAHVRQIKKWENYGDISFCFLCDFFAGSCENESILSR